METSANKAGCWRLTVGTSFSSSHRLRHYQGKCEALHGHNFEVSVSVEGDELDPKTEILMDFKELKALVAQVVGPLDHTDLNALPAFSQANPSSENLARHIFVNLKPLLPERVRLASVAVSEKSTSKAEYFERPPES